MDWKIGCSGFHYPDWKGIFYPDDLPQRKWFEYYCGHYNTVELNVTYYRFPRVEVLRKWYARSPGGFSFSVKAPRHITHFKRFRDAQRMLLDFNEAVREGLRDKLGFVLFQFPSSFAYEPASLERITAMLDPSVRSALEFRHDSWWNDDVFAALSQANIAFCGMSHPGLPDTVVRTTDALYYRFHGVPHLYTSAYTTGNLEQVARAMQRSGTATEAWVYFNNTADGHAVTNARQFQEICELVH